MLIYRGREQTLEGGREGKKSKGLLKKKICKVKFTDKES